MALPYLCVQRTEKRSVKTLHKLRDNYIHISC